MLDNPKNYAQTLKRGFRVLDPLTEMLRGLRLDGVEYGRCMPTAPWGASYAPGETAYFHFVANGSAWLQPHNSDWIELKAGDSVLLPRGEGHVLSSSPGVPAKPLKLMSRKTVCEGIVDVYDQNYDGGTLLFFAVLRFNLDQEHPLLRMMPSVMQTRDLAQSEPTIPALLDAMMREVNMSRVGAGGILSRLADVLTATIIRTWVENGYGDPSGWLAAVRNPDIGRVLASVHLKPTHSWSVDELANVMGASRSSFAQRFVDAVGVTPARYVAKMRMHQAKQWLREGRRVSSVAEILGYESEASFSRAFKRMMGTSPSRVRV